MKDKFVVDNYEGIPVVCTRSVWDEHVVLHHKVMEKNVDAVKDTIKDPDSVYQSKDYENREVYFKASEFSTYPMLTKVIVEDGISKAGNPKGEVVTAFNTKKEEGGIADVVYKRETDKL